MTLRDRDTGREITGSIPVRIIRFGNGRYHGQVGKVWTTGRSGVASRSEAAKQNQREARRRKAKVKGYKRLASPRFRGEVSGEKAVAEWRGSATKLGGR